MAQYGLNQQNLPAVAVQNLKRLGAAIRIARKRRKLTLAEMASRMFVSRKTLARLEKGDTGVSLAVLAAALWVLGFEGDLLYVVNPERDTIGIWQERQRLPQRVRPAAPEDDLDF